ncbi:hypothetical protein ES703_37117 [subsurface metagenome]
MRIKNIFKIFRKKGLKEILLNQKINSMQNDLTIIKMQMKTIIVFLKKIEKEK